MKHCDTCRCEETELRESYFGGIPEFAVGEYMKVMQAAYARVSDVFYSMERVRFFAADWQAERDELKAWVAEHALDDSQPIPWRPYRPELVTPFYGKEWKR